jgi:hypothetical protein
MNHADPLADLGAEPAGDGSAVDIRPEGREPDHRIVAADAIDGGIRLRCSCSWRSDVFPSGIGVAGAWEEHVQQARPG